jgi:D-alanine-D-alanine ligase
MKKKIRVAILFGGQSVEHEISLVSARNIVEAMDKSKYEIVAIGIDKQGRWFLDEGGRLLLDRSQSKVKMRDKKNVGAVVPGVSNAPMVRSATGSSIGALDVIFPVLHGPFGEDGTVQGLLKLANVPFVGAGVLGSAVGMDKDVMKRLLRDAGIPIAKFLVSNAATANLGSSVGISKVTGQGEFRRAIKEAFLYDSKILVEESISGREIECAVLGNEHPAASLPGEIITGHRFYSYDAKYIDDQGARLIIPAELPPAVTRRIQELAVQTFTVLCCAGMARVDFFLRGKNEIFVNEINTIPGFTKISMYPKMWSASGLSYPRLIDRLIQLAMQKFRAERNLRTTI